MLLFGGVLGGMFFDAGYFRLMIWVGLFMVVFGSIATPLASKYYQFMLARGPCIGYDMSLFLVASVRLPSTCSTNVEVSRSASQLQGALSLVSSYS